MDIGKNLMNFCCLHRGISIFLFKRPENNYLVAFPVFNSYVLFPFETNWFLLGSPIWKPRDHGPDWEGSGSEAGSEVRGQRPPRSEKTVGFESPQSNGKKETLQSACKRKWTVTLCKNFARRATTANGIRFMILYEVEPVLAEHFYSYFFYKSNLDWT